METNIFFNEGKSFAEQVWEKNPNSSAADVIKLLRKLRFTILLKSTSPEENNNMLDGVCSFFAEKGVESIDIDTFNKDFDVLSESTGYEGYLRLVDDLLPRIDDPSCEEGEAVDIPVGIRPQITHFKPWGEDINGVIGRIYFFNESYPPMFLPYCDVYSKEVTDLLIEERVPLLSSQVKTSEVLTAMQAVVDPGHDNKELSDAIQKCLILENEEEESPLYKFLFDKGIFAISFCEQEENPMYFEDVCGQVKNIVLDNNGCMVYADIEESSADEYHECEINPTTHNYDRILEEVKKAINATVGKKSTN